VADADVGHGQAAGGAAVGVDQDAAVHLLVLDLDPLAVQADLGAVVGGAVKALRKGAVHVGGDGDAVAGADRHGAVVVDGVEDLAQGVGRGGAHLKLGVAVVGLPLADVDVLDDVGAAVRQDLVEDLGQEERVDDVAVQLDFLDEAAAGRRCRVHVRLRPTGIRVRPPALFYGGGDKDERPSTSVRRRGSLTPVRDTRACWPAGTGGRGGDGPPSGTSRGGPASWGAASMRLATLTTSPMAVTCRLGGWPRSATMTAPTWTPTPMVSVSSNCRDR